jgi:ribonuclease R
MRKNKTTPGADKLSASELRKEALNFLKKHPKKHFNPRQIAQHLNVGNNKHSILDALGKLADTGQILRLEDFKFKLKPTRPEAPEKRSLPRPIARGSVDMTRNGDAYIVPDDRSGDVWVQARKLNGALHGDIVEIKIWQPRGRHRPEGEVTKVLKRATELFIGTVRVSNKFGIVIPDNLRMPVDIVVKLDDLNGAKDGDKVVVKILKWHGGQLRTPFGAVTNIFGQEWSSDIEMKSILLNNGFPLDFPEGVIEQSEKIPAEISIQEVQLRRDFRQVITFTIDPEDAKDFDDAISVLYLDDGEVEIGVHIADVSHFVKPGSPLDEEAFRRATSVYLVDRVLPMLPERLSNDLCSLRPAQERLTFSAVFVFDKNDQIKSRWFGKTIIFSDRRFSYEEVQAILENGAGDYFQELSLVNRLAKKLRKERFQNGSIDFDMEEVRFRLAEDGTPLEVFVKERKDAHMLIEDFMLLANREVAMYIHKRGQAIEVPFVYRVHDQPDPDKVEELSRFAKEMGFEMKVNTPAEIARSYNRLTEMAKQNESLKLLEPIAIRTMAKAVYSAENIGHYGLGFAHYTHFTSPIRRYSDVLSHRILERNLEGNTYRIDKSLLETQCKHISTLERKAMDAERESVKFKQAEFMEKHIGESFEGVISGIIDRGVFVELKNNKCEGMVGFESMPESFEIDSGRLRAVGRVTGQVLRMGANVHVKIIDVDLMRRAIDMEFAEK